MAQMRSTESKKDSHGSESLFRLRNSKASSHLSSQPLIENSENHLPTEDLSSSLIQALRNGKLLISQRTRLHPIRKIQKIYEPLV